MGLMNAKIKEYIEVLLYLPEGDVSRQIEGKFIALQRYCNLYWRSLAMS